ncbi:unnamed protein product [Gongylonema pulchrum]|uniref:Uncharacterized protein n=1 Tax=Gongylonema pulchrum TaxID=637853 RepID=A0A183D717_9BILA|nr:unnamed protein product [Gongylonema pulchrum]
MKSCLVAGPLQQKSFGCRRFTAVQIADLRNRRTGRRIPDLAKQYLITLSKRSDSGDDGAVSENIVGVHADTDFLFILTTADLFAFKVRHFREENNLVEMT